MPHRAPRSPAMILLVAVLAGVPTTVVAHDAPDEKEVAFAAPLADVAGVLTLLHSEKGKPTPGTIPCVVIVGGSLSHTHDGGFDRAGAPKRDALARLAHALADRGYVSLRYDQVGHGDSKPKPGWSNSYRDQAAVVAAAVAFVRGRKELGPVVVAGESAGAYLACLAAKEGASADAYVFLGGHCGPGEAIYEYNFGRLVGYAEAGPEQRAWVEKNARFELALGRHYRAMFAAAAKGEKTFEMVDGDFRRSVDLVRRQEELKMTPDEMFKHIQVPALALSGQRDLNVPPDHAARIVAVLRRAGNHATTCAVIPGADHSFQKTSADEDERFRERYTFASFRREYDPRLYQEVIAWLDQTVKGKAPAAAKSRDIPEPFSLRGLKQVEKDSKTENTPARTYLAPGIQLIEDVTDRGRTAAVETLEGRIGPLLLAQDSQAHFIDMPAGMYCDEHPHNSESIIYTVRGKWVLCSAGRRHVMKPGTLFHFAVNTPTGYEVPFAEDAYILIFKGKRKEKEEDFIKYLKGLAARLKREHEAGVPYLLRDLPKDHPALRFAREVNPTFAAGAATPGPGGSWAGRKVVMKKVRVKLTDTDGSGKRVEVGELRYLEQAVLADQGERLKVLQQGVEGWFDRADAVLLEDAIPYFTGRIEGNPKDAIAFHARGVVRARQGDHENALKDLSEAIRLNPAAPMGWNGRGVVHQSRKDYDRALADFTEGVRLDPRSAEGYCNRGNVHRARKDYERALADFNDAIRADPKDPLGYNQTAWLHSVCPDAKFRDGKKAVELATRACELTHWKRPGYIDTLASAYAEAGQFDEAIKQQQRALEDEGYQVRHGVWARKVLEQYRNRQPYREE